MCLLPEISKIFIVEDQPYTDHEYALVLPESLQIEDANDLRLAFIGSRQYKGLWTKMEYYLGEELKSELVKFIDNEEPGTFNSLEAWYKNDGMAIWSEIWTGSEYFKDEYNFLDGLEKDRYKIFGSYEEAINHIKDCLDIPEDDKLNLWLLDREFGEENQDFGILNLLELLSTKNDSIGLIYSARTEGLLTRADIYAFVKKNIEENVPDIQEKFKEFIRTQFSDALFIESDDFVAELSTSFNQIYESKVYLNNLVWVMPKNETPITEKIGAILKQAIHGFEVFKLIKIHTIERKSSLKSGLIKTTLLELDDIEHLKLKSIEEGTNISDTLIRIHDGFTKQELSKRLADKNEYFDAIRKIEAWEPSNLELSSNNFFNDLQSNEKFDYNVNSLFKPLMTGDIFEISHPTNNGNNSKNYLLLLTQECDCVVRNIRNTDDKQNRKVNVATLIKLVPKKIKAEIGLTEKVDEMITRAISEIDGSQDIESVKQAILECGESLKQMAPSQEPTMYKIPFQPFIHQENYYKFNIYLRQTFHLDFKILDLCTLNSNGDCGIDFNNIDYIKNNILTLYPKAYRNYLLGLIDELSKLSQQHTNSTMISAEVEDRNIETFIKNGTKIDYRLRRLARLNMPYQAFIQAFYGLTQSNVGLPMDF